MTPHPAVPRRVVLVSGAGGRLGSALCRMLLADHEVVAVYRTRHPDVASQEQWFVDPRDPARPLEDNRRAAFAVRADLTAPTSIAHVVELGLARFRSIDAVVNGAATWRFGSTLANRGVLDAALDQFTINTLVPALLAQEVARQHWRDTPGLNRDRNRVVVNLVGAAEIERPTSGQGVHRATKVALNALTRHMAVDYEPIAVRVVGVAPASFPRVIPMAAAAAAVAEAIDSPVPSGTIVIVDEHGRRSQ